MQYRRFIAPSGRANPEIDQATFQMGTFNSVGDCFVMRIGHNQRQAKTA